LIGRIKYLIWDNIDPHNNLALEEYLLKHVQKGECILYLWQNEKTVVIGRNQNALKECKVKELEEDGGYLVRRLSGGGAVFHDLGNLNFTFLVKKEDYNVEKQMEVILEAVRSFGIPAEKSGRNDITVDGKKFSGNAFYQDGDACYHHGTILLSVDMSKLSHYLNVSREKLVAKGVESVRARVTNLSEFSGNINVENMKEALVKAFSKVYGLVPEPFDRDSIGEEEWKSLVDKFSSWDYKYGRKLESNYSVERKFSWGMTQIHFLIDFGRVQEVTVYTDALDVSIPERLEMYLKGSIFSSKELAKALSPLLEDDRMKEIAKDVIALLVEEGL